MTRVDRGVAVTSPSAAAATTLPSMTFDDEPTESSPIASKKKASHNGARLRLMRERRRLSRRDVQSQTGISCYKVGRIERGDGSICLADMNAILAFYKPTRSEARVLSLGAPTSESYNWAKVAKVSSLQEAECEAEHFLALGSYAKAENAIDAMAFLAAPGDAADCARVWLRRGHLLGSTGRTREAEENLLRAEQYFASKGMVGRVLNTLCNRSMLAIQEDRFYTAEALARHILLEVERCDLSEAKGDQIDRFLKSEAFGHYMVSRAIFERKLDVECERKERDMRIARAIELYADIEKKLTLPVYTDWCLIHQSMYQLLERREDQAAVQSLNDMIRKYGPPEDVHDHENFCRASAALGSALKRSNPKEALAHMNNARRVAKNHRMVNTVRWISQIVPSIILLFTAFTANMAGTETHADWSSTLDTYKAERGSAKVLEQGLSDQAFKARSERGSA